MRIGRPLCRLGIHAWKQVEVKAPPGLAEGKVLPKVRVCARCGAMELRGTLRPGEAMLLPGGFEVAYSLTDCGRNDPCAP